MIHDDEGDEGNEGDDENEDNDERRFLHLPRLLCFRLLTTTREKFIISLCYDQREIIRQLTALPDGSSE